MFQRMPDPDASLNAHTEECRCRSVLRVALLCYLILIAGCMARTLVSDALAHCSNVGRKSCCEEVFVEQV